MLSQFVGGQVLKLMTFGTVVECSGENARDRGGSAASRWAGSWYTSIFPPGWGLEIEMDRSDNRGTEPEGRLLVEKQRGVTGVSFPFL